MEATTAKATKANNQTGAPAEDQTSKGNRPLKTIRDSGVSASVFRNEIANEDGTTEFFKVTVARTYKDKNGDFKQTHSFSTKDLDSLARVIAEAKTFIIACEAAKVMGMAEEN